MIQTKIGNVYYVSDSIPNVKTAIEQGDIIKVWWFASNGSRYAEQLLISSEEVSYLRSESDDG